MALLFLSAAAAPAPAQDWPGKTVRIVVPFGAGSTPNIVARLVAGACSINIPRLRSSYKPGASGNLGTDAVAKVAPDGSIIGVSIGGPLAINRVLFAKLPYDPQEDIVPITQLVTQPSVLAVQSRPWCQFRRGACFAAEEEPRQIQFRFHWNRLSVSSRDGSTGRLLAGRLTCANGWAAKLPAGRR